MSEGKTKDGRATITQKAWAVKCQVGIEKSGEVKKSGKLSKNSWFRVISSCNQNTT